MIIFYVSLLIIIYAIWIMYNNMKRKKRTEILNKIIGYDIDINADANTILDISQRHVANNLVEIISESQLKHKKEIIEILDHIMLIGYYIGTSNEMIFTYGPNVELKIIKQEVDPLYRNCIIPIDKYSLLI